MVAGAARPYHLAVFCTARHLLDKPNLGLRKMRREWGLLGRAVKKAASAGDDAPATAAAATTFLAVVEFEAAREVFHRLGVDSLPWVVTVKGDVAVEDDGGEIPGIDHDAVMRHATYGHKHWDADDFATFVADRTGGARITIDKPPRRPSFFGVMTGIAILATLAAAGWKFYNSALAAWMPLWVGGTLAVWWFATSGGMYNIIRGMPLVLPTRSGVRLFLDGSSGQVGFEGFLMGTLYSAVGLLLAALATLVTRAKDEQARRVWGYVCVALAWFAYTRVVSVHDWKTGFTWSQYLV